MKILILLSRIPYPLDKGDKLRAFHQIKSLSEKHDLVLFCLSDPTYQFNNYKESLSKYCSKVEIYKLTYFSIFIQLCMGLFKNIPFQTAYFYNSKAKRKLMDLVQSEKPDRIFCQMIRTTEYLKNIDIPCVLDYQDALSKGMERRLKNSSLIKNRVLRVEYKRLLQYENDVFERFDQKIIISENDRDFIQHLRKNEIQIIPNGVDLNYFEPKEMEKSFSILFTGNMGYPPNIAAACFLANEILPLVHKRISAANVLISGARPSHEVLNLQSKHVTVSGWVEDIRDSYNSAMVFVAPMLNGSGLQNKLLEAMAMKLPCITTTLANKALGAENNKNIMVADTAEEIAENIVLLLTKKEKAEAIRLAGFEFVSSKYNWEKINDSLEKIISNAK